MVVYATELLLRAEASGSPADTLIASLPVVFVITLSLGGALVVWRGREVYQDAPCDGQGCSLGWRVVVPVVLAGVCVVVPLFVLGQRVQLGAAMEETLRIYGGDVVDSVWLAALGGLTSVFLGSLCGDIGQDEISLPGLRNAVSSGTGGDCRWRDCRGLSLDCGHL